MKKHKSRVAKALMGGLVGLGLAAPASAMVYGTCEAWYQIRSSAGGGTEAYSGRFAAIGVDATNADEARANARDRLDRCIADHWSAPNASTAPDRCSGGRPGRPGVTDYPFTNLMADIAALACAANPGVAVLSVSVVVVVEGEAGCLPPGEGWAIDPFPPWLRVDCAVPGEIVPLPRLDRPAPQPERIVPMPRLEPVIAPPLPGIRLPGSDIRRVWIGDDGWARCEDLCAETFGCRAWTWRAPGTSGAGSEAACLLKRAAGWQVPDPCCHSGIRE
jgi:PAN domain